MSNTATTIDFGKLYAIQPITFAPLKKINWTLKYGSKIFKLSEFSQEIGLEPYVKPGNTAISHLADETFLKKYICWGIVGDANFTNFHQFSPIFANFHQF